MINQSKINEVLLKNFDIQYEYRYHLKYIQDYEKFIDEIQRLCQKDFEESWTVSSQSKSYDGVTFSRDGEREPSFHQLTNFLISIDLHMPYLLVKKIEEKIVYEKYTDNDYYTTSEKTRKFISIDKIVEVLEELNYYNHDESFRNSIMNKFDQNCFHDLKNNQKKRHK